MRFLLLFLAIAACGCHKAPFLARISPSTFEKCGLTARSEYLRPNYLASEHINTPDPWRKCFYGQQIIVHWNLPFSTPAEMVLQVRFGNRETDSVKAVLDKQKGYWVYRLVNQDYWERGGILSYKVEIYQNGELVECWKHALWAEMIDLAE